MLTFRALREKTLTAAEKKKREEVAKAIERENPNMPMDKKMAIATATAKKVAEQSDSLDEVSQATKDRYFQKSVRAHGHLNAVRKDAESRGDTELAKKMRHKMKMRNQGQARALGQTKNNW